MKKYTLSQTKRKYNLLRVIFFCLFPALCIMGSDRKMIHVKDIQLHIKDGNLIVSAQCVNLFSKKCISTLQSGVTSVVHVDMELVEEGWKHIDYIQLPPPVSISYDPWEEKYTLQSEDSISTFNQLDLVTQLGSRIHQIPLIKESLLKPSTDYEIKIRFEIIPIFAGQGDQISDWLENSNMEGENLTSDERSNTFRINVTKMISLFIGKKKRPQNRSGWFSKSFKFTKPGFVVQ